MAFFSKAGNVLRQISQKGINQEIAASKPSILQIIRCMSTSKVFVGGLAWATDDASLREAFSNYGEVAEARVIQDRETGRSRGFGFVTFDSEEAASAAIQALDGRELHGRTVRVNYANERPRSFGPSGGYSSGGGGYTGGGYSSGGGGYTGGGYSSGGGGYTGGGYASGGGGYGGGGGGYGNTYGEQGGGNTYGAPGSGGYNAGLGGYAGGDAYASPGDAPSGGDYGGFGATTGSSSGEQFGNDNSGDIGGTNGVYNPGEPAGGDLRDEDDVSGDFANRRG